jgi:hypothetical protein
LLLLATFAYRLALFDGQLQIPSADKLELHVISAHAATNIVAKSRVKLLGTRLTTIDSRLKNLCRRSLLGSAA